MTLELKQAIKRGSFHALVGAVVAICLLVLPRFAAIIGLAVITAIFLTLDIARIKLSSFQFVSYFFAPLIRNRENNGLTGSSYFLIGSLITAVAFPQPVAALAILFLALGDPMATVIGMRLGRIRLWDKSMEGNLACLLVCLLIGFIFSSFVGEPALTAAVTGAIAATILQALPSRINDNITIPVGSALAMWLINLI